MEISRQVRDTFAERPNDLRVFNSGGVPSEIITETQTEREIDSKCLPTFRIRQMNQATIAGKVETVFNIREQTVSGEIRDRAAPKDLRDRLISDFPRELPPLRGIVSHPVATPEGHLTITRGYDRETGLFCTDDSDYSMLTDPISLAEAKESYEYLSNSLFADFSFAEPEDKAAAVSLVLTQLSRALMEIAPGYAISSPVYGDGKTALAHTATAGVFGKPASSLSLPNKEEELQKVLLSALAAGNESILFDNVSSKVDHQSDVLAQVLTSPVFEGRLLCTNNMLRVPTNATIIFTGKNVRFRADLSSRIVTCRLQPKPGQDRRRKFSRAQPENWAVQNRRKVVLSGLRIFKGYKDAGMPRADLRPCRFQQWE